MTPGEVLLSPKALTLQWQDSGTVLDAGVLRANCRCADCRAAALRGRPAALVAGIELTGLVPLGHYAVQLQFSDGHERGIYPWPYLRQLAGLQDVTSVQSPP
ncbi:gamma-butyrobetaine hydroxylase-like domain-containing protein [Jeongeupia naejangsanensis]|uniref:DUF971 domain-containing protein n=1 Tax=Jeongeupia naejangsanensis TaxID=613195 RepID=A0ABS2BG55_9NEIS|nr:DUF971 domain-containing protein [Jeongeupia naejangsanensis]MBM3114599.1 DUF971 domain-containing protein [Jeongeupia naejangsanensis]